MSYAGRKAKLFNLKGKVISQSSSTNYFLYFATSCSVADSFNFTTEWQLRHNKMKSNSHTITVLEIVWKLFQALCRGLTSNDWSSLQFYKCAFCYRTISQKTCHLKRAVYFKDYLSLEAAATAPAEIKSLLVFHPHRSRIHSQNKFFEKCRWSKKLKLIPK